MSTAPPRRRLGLAFPAHTDDKSLGPAAITTDMLIAAAGRVHPGRAGRPRLLRCIAPVA